MNITLASSLERETNGAELDKNLVYTEWSQRPIKNKFLQV